MSTTARARAVPATAVYVYGVVPAGTRIQSARGVARASVRTVHGDGAAAIVSSLPDGGLEAGREDLLAHARVLERALERDVVLPMQFGVVMADAEEVRGSLLVAFRDDLLAQMDQLRGKVELHLRAVYDEEALMTELVRSHPEIAGRSESLRDRPADGTYYERIALGQLIAEAVDRARALDTVEIVGALEPLSVALDVGAVEHERVAAQLAFLVERERLAEFDAAVDELGRRNEGRLRFKYTGPLPAYSFVDLPRAA